MASALVRLLVFNVQSGNLLVVPVSMVANRSTLGDIKETKRDTRERHREEDRGREREKKKTDGERKRKSERGERERGGENGVRKKERGR